MPHAARSVSSWTTLTFDISDPALILANQKLGIKCVTQREQRVRETGAQGAHNHSKTTALWLSPVSPLPSVTPVFLDLDGLVPTSDPLFTNMQGALSDPLDGCTAGALLRTRTADSVQ